MPSAKLRVYSACWWLLLPVVLLRLCWRGRKEAGYLAHIPERFGLGEPLASPLIWVHAVSVGETRAAEPLIRSLLQRYPSHHILLTHMTPTGRAAGAALFGRESRVVQRYLPYDTLQMTRRFIAHARPQWCVLMETEVWPALIEACREAVALVNARLSERSLRRARRFEALIGEAVRTIDVIAAQTEADAQRLRQLGAQTVSVTGSLKFDITPPEPMLALGTQWRKQIGQRPVLLCASTREGEEALLLDAYMRTTLPYDFLLMIVPRHPQRFADVEQMLEQRGLRFARRSQMGDSPLPAATQVLLGDSMGEMFAYYVACGVAFIGGSLLPLGGQNLIEALSCGKPVLVGPHTFNFSLITEDAVAAGAARRVIDAAQMMKEASALLQDSVACSRLSSVAVTLTVEAQGATQRTVDLLAPVIH